MTKNKFVPGTLHLKKLIVFMHDIYLPPPIKRIYEFEKYLWDVAIKQERGEKLTESEKAAIEYMESWGEGDEDDED